MKNVRITLKSLIKRLSALTTFDDAFDYLEHKLKLSKVGNGSYARCYKWNKYVIKLSPENTGDNFKQILTGLRRNAIFKKYVVPVIWIHRRGFALICDYVRILFSKPVEEEFEKEIREQFKTLRRGLGDLHDENLVYVEYKGKQQILLVDYGCII